MIAYTAVLEVRTDLPVASVTRALADYAAAVYREPQGYLEVVLRLPAESERQATSTALAVVKEATGGAVVALDVTPAAPGDEQVTDATPVDVRAEVLGHLRVLGTRR